jgi:hypothetical protein
MRLFSAGHHIRNAGSAKMRQSLLRSFAYIVWGKRMTSTNTAQAASAEVATLTKLIQMANGYRISRLLYVAAELGIADHLAEQAKTAEDIAAAIGVHPLSLRRVMRTLASLGVFSEDAMRRFSLTPLGAALKTNAPGAARAAVRTLAGQPFWRAWEHILYTLETGTPAFDKALGKGQFEYFAAHPELAKDFSDTMVAFHGNETDAVASAYDFAGLRTIVDVGGATGNMLAAILQRHPHLHGVLFDLPHVVRDAALLLDQKQVAHQVTIKAGSFFDYVPDGGDAYVLSHIIHDWDEEKCVTILENCRKAMRAESRLLIVEMVLPAGNAFHPGKLLDIAMLVQAGGMERTADEYRELLKRARFNLTRVVPTDSAASIVEAVPQGA